MNKLFFPGLLSLACLLTVGCSDEPSTGTSGTETPADQAASEAPEPSVSVDDSAEASVKAILEGLSAGDGTVLWNALPEGHQKDVTDIVQQFAGAMNPMVWDQIHGLLAKIHALLEKQKDFIVNSSVVKESGQADVVAEAVPAVTAFLGTILDSTKLDNLKAFDGEKFFAGPVSQLLKQGDVLARLAPGGATLASLRNSTVETVSEEGDTATLKITPPAEAGETLEPREMKFVRVDGHWLPEDLQKDWDQNVANTKEQLKTLPETSKEMAAQVPMIVGMVSGILAPLEAAETQEQFDKALSQVQSMAGGMLGGFAPGLGGPPSGSAGEPDGSTDAGGPPESISLDESAESTPGADSTEEPSDDTAE